MKNNYGFKFEIGEIVRFAVIRPINDKDRAMKGYFKDSKAMVVSRLLDECPGGVQRHYNVRFFVDTDFEKGVGEMSRFNEIELRKAED